MEKSELKEKIDLIFENEKYTRSKNKPLKSYNPKIKSGGRVTLTRTVFDTILELEKTGDVVFDPKDYTESYPNLELMLKLYNDISYSEKLKKYFVECLFEYWDDWFFRHIITEFMIKTDNLSVILQEISFKNIEKLTPIFTVLDELLTYEYTLFSRDQLISIKKNTSDLINSERFMKNYRKKGRDTTFSPLKKNGDLILKRIHKILYRALSKSIDEGTDFQISADRKKIEGKISYFGFDSILTKILDKVEEMYWSTSTDEFDNSMAMDKLRTFWERTVELICERIYEKTGETYPKTEDSRMGNLRKYMQKHLKLRKEHNLMNKLVEILNDKGSHNFISEKEYFRLTKNITIELAMLLFVKLEKFIEN